jgi:hypothetical protein
MFNVIVVSIEFRRTRLEKSCNFICLSSINKVLLLAWQAHMKIISPCSVHKYMFLFNLCFNYALIFSPITNLSLPWETWGNGRNKQCSLLFHLHPLYCVIINLLNIFLDIFFKLVRCGYTLRVTSQASYSPEYITPNRQKKIMITRSHWYRRN